MTVASPIGYPITLPMGSRRVCPNRPRIAHINPCRVSPFFIQDQAFNLTVGASLRPACPDVECTRYAGVPSWL